MRTIANDIGAWASAAKYAGGDLGLTRDSSTLAIVATHGEDLALVELLECRPEKGAPLKLSEVIATFAGVLREHGLSSFMADGWSREPAREHATREGVAIEDAPAGRNGKTQAYLATRDALREGTLRLPNEARLRAQLRSIRARPIAGGSLDISAPRRSGHGDLVSSLVLAVWQARQGGPVIYDTQWDAYIPKMRV